MAISWAGKDYTFGRNLLVFMIKSIVHAGVPAATKAAHGRQGGLSSGSDPSPGCPGPGQESALVTRALPGTPPRAPNEGRLSDAHSQPPVNGSVGSATASLCWVAMLGQR